MCMMVDDSVKTKDRDSYTYEEIKKDIQMMKSGKASYITKNGLIGRISHSFNNRTPQSGGITKEQKTELMNLVMSLKDERTIDYAIRSCDSLADLRGSTAVGNGYVKDNGSEFIVMDAYGNVKGRYTTPEEADKAARKL